MSFTSVAPCIVVLHQQQEQDIGKLCYSNDALDGQPREKPEYCTIVENGKVVVKKAIGSRE